MIIELYRSVNLGNTVPVEMIYNAIYGGESNAHKWIISQKNGSDLTGSVSAKFLRADRTTVALSGSIVNGKAEITLGEPCYAVPGVFHLAIFLTNGDETLCIYACGGTVARTSSNTIIDGGTIIDDISDLIAAIDEAVESIPPDYSALVDETADLKNAFNSTNNVVASNIQKSKNLFSVHVDLLNVQRDGLIYSKSNDGTTYIVSGTSTAGSRGNYTVLWLFGALNYEDSVLPAGTYTFTFSEMVNVPFLTIKYSYGEEGTSSTTIISHNETTASVTFTQQAHVFLQITSGRTFENSSFRCQIEEGSTATEFTRSAEIIDYTAREKVPNLNRISQFAYPGKVAYAAYRCQGGCVVGDKFIWLLYNSQGKVVMHSLNVITGTHSGSVLPDGTDTSTLYHCNDITYNPITQKYYVATLLSTGTIAVLDSDFVYQSSINPVDGNGLPVSPVGVAYDRLHDQFIVFCDDLKFYVYDNSWAYVRTIVTDAESEPTVHQGIETDGYYIYRARTDSPSVSEIPHPHLRTYTMSGHFIEEYTVEQIAGEEVESVAYDWNNSVFFVNTNSKNVAQTNVYLMPPNNLSYHIMNEIAYMLK